MCLLKGPWVAWIRLLRFHYLLVEARCIYGLPEQLCERHGRDVDTVRSEVGDQILHLTAHSQFGLGLVDVEHVGWGRRSIPEVAEELVSDLLQRLRQRHEPS